MAIKIYDKTKNIEDLELLVDLTFESFKSPAGYSKSRDASRELYVVTNDFKHKMLVAYDSECFAGFCTYGPVGLEEPLYSMSMDVKGLKYEPKSSTISMIAVTNKKRCKGVGKELVKKVMKESKKLGLKHVYVTCFSGEEGDSYKLFKSLGYEEIPIQHVYPDGSMGVKMYKEL